MKTLVIISTLFVIGSLVGYVLEIFFRRFISMKRWVNPGFLVGPYIPIYGFGVILLYGLSNINLVSLGLPEYGAVLIKILIIGISMTLIELIAGLIFIKGLHIKLWDYSSRWGNFKGIICPLFSFIWFIVGCLYYFFLNPVFVQGISWISDNLIYSYFIGAVIGAMVVDACYSLHLGFKIKESAGNLVIKYELFKLDIKDEFYDEKEKHHRFYGSLINLARHNNSLAASIKKSYEKLPKPQKWWSKRKEKSEDK